MKKFVEWLSEWLSNVWAVIAITTITFGGIGVSIKVITWVLDLLGVM